MKEYAKLKNVRRRYKRYAVDGIQGKVLNLAGLEIINISMDGAALETTRRLELNREYAFKIHHNDISLSLRGRVVWAILISKETKDGGGFTPVYRVGLTFTDRFGENADIFLRLIEDVKIKLLRSRLRGISVRIADIGNIGEAYKVRKLSMCGMLVETACPIAIGSYHLIELFLNGHLLKVEGRISGCDNLSAGESPQYQYDVSIDFVGVRDEYKGFLRQFLRSLESEIGLVLLFLFVLNYKA